MVYNLPSLGMYTSKQIPKTCSRVNNILKTINKEITCFKEGLGNKKGNY